MKVAFALYDGFSALEFSTMYEPLTRQEIEWQVCALTTDVYDSGGLHFSPTLVAPELEGFDLVIIPGGPGTSRQQRNSSLLAWLASATGTRRLAATGDGVLLLAAAGLARGRRVAASAGLHQTLCDLGALPVLKTLVTDGSVSTAQGIGSTQDLAIWLCEELGSDQVTAAHALVPVTGSAGQGERRRATVTRQTGETQIEVRLDIDGTGQHAVDTGLPFLDHMLVQVAVHGLFDLFVKARGDLHIDPHHTLEDTALTLGAAFQQALGERVGIVRMASAECPMDESLAWVAVDFSGRPYTVFDATWYGPSVGDLPTSLVQHFFESFALNARCNLHAAVRYGRDNHHQAEALFKAFGRALCAATRVDPRRSGQVPSSKGILF